MSTHPNNLYKYLLAFILAISTEGATALSAKTKVSKEVEAKRVDPSETSTDKETEKKEKDEAAKEEKVEEKKTDLSANKEAPSPEEKKEAAPSTTTTENSEKEIATEPVTWFVKVAEKATPAVVNISTTQVLENKNLERGDFPRMPGTPFDLFRDFFDQFDRPTRPRRIQSLGSGFIVKSDGNVAFIVTNAHLIADAKKIAVILHDKTQLEAEVHATDDRTDLAVLKVKTAHLPKDKRHLPILNWGDSSRIKVGQWVVAIGNPFGLGSTVTAGIISNRARDIGAHARSALSEFVPDLIQHDASINPGNSGGPLLNEKGDVVGINTAIFSPTGSYVGIGLAIPTEVAKGTIDQLLECGRTRRGWLGVRVQNVTDEIAESLNLGNRRGALVGSVTEGGPAHKAGVEPGDFIIKFDGKEVTEDSRLTRLVGETPVGKEVEVIVWRKGKEHTLKIKLGEFETAVKKEHDKASGEKEKGKTPDDSLEYMGLTLRTISPILVQTYSLNKDAKGVLITRIDPDSRLLDAGLMPGDIISEVNQEEISTPQEFQGLIEKAKKAKRKNVLLLITRDGGPLYVTIKIDEEEESVSSSPKKEDKKR